MAKILIFLLLTLFGAIPVLGDTPADQLKETVTGTVDIRQETQRQEDRWANEKVALEARYRASKAHVDSLEKQAALWEGKIGFLREQVDELNRRIEESERLEANLNEILAGVTSGLEQAVEKDLPFLPEERAQRLAFLRETLAQTDVSGAEKLRHLLEALLVECEYGDTVEVYEQRIQVGGEPVFANVFRLGRLSLFWQTPDGNRVGEYGRLAERWVELPQRYVRDIGAAVEMAEKRRPIELVKLPVGRINP